MFLTRSGAVDIPPVHCLVGNTWQYRLLQRKIKLGGAGAKGVCKEEKRMICGRM